MEGVNHIQIVGKLVDHEFCRVNGVTGKKDLLRLRIRVTERVPRAREWVDVHTVFVASLWDARARALAQGIKDGSIVAVAGSVRHVRVHDSARFSGNVTEGRRFEIVATHASVIASPQADPSGERGESDGEPYTE